jgi:integrase
MTERQVSITARLARELETLWEQTPKDERQRVFGIVSNVKRSLTAARNAAGLSDVRFHDLRHTHATRLVGAHIPLSEVGRVLGHTQPSTTYRYVNANVETARRGDYGPLARPLDWEQTRCFDLAQRDNLVVGVVLTAKPIDEPSTT